MQVEQLAYRPEPAEKGKIKTFRYNPEDFYLWENLPRPRLLRVTPHGHDALPTDIPPKKRGIVIALGYQQQIVIAYPYGNTESEGFHDHSEAWAVDKLGRLRSWAILHGSITQSHDEKGNKTRTAYIYEASPEDKAVIQRHGSYLDQGKVDPMKFLEGPDFIPERIMQILSARELKIVEGIASTSLYNLTRAHR